MKLAAKSAVRKHLSLVTITPLDSLAGRGLGAWLETPNGLDAARCSQDDEWTSRGKLWPPFGSYCYLLSNEKEISHGRVSW